MALEPITRQEKIIAGQDLTPITRMEKFLKQFGGGGGGLPSGGAPYQQLVTDGEGNAKWEDRLAYETEPVVTEIVPEETVAFSDSEFGKSAVWPPTFNPVEGSIYIIRFDGAEYTCPCVRFNGTLTLGNLTLAGVGDDTGEPFIMAKDRSWLFVSADSASEHTISISGMQVSISKIDEKYLPDNLATKSDVEVAQTTADNAQATADNAQTTADNAQTTADSNKKRLSELFESVAKFTFDKQTSGRDTFVFNAFNFYKISDFNPAPEDVISFKGTSESGDEYSTIMTGNNAMGYGLFIVVAAAGRCSITLHNIHGEQFTREFTAPSAGLYACYKEGNTSMTAGTGEFTIMAIDGLTIKSSTAGSTKKFKITVDDSGTISATEVLA